MEVHQPHHPTHKKKWAEYLLEFVMLFLAVFLGFLAENIREHAVERKRGKQYLESYKNDLLENQAIYKHYDSIFRQLLPVYDSIVSIYHEKRENEDLQTLARLLSKGKITLNIPFNTTTYSQMVSSGSMRLINNRTIANAMGKYSNDIIVFKEFDLQLKALRANIYPEVLKLEDIHDFFPFRDSAQRKLNPTFIPEMDKFPPLSEQQRRILISYYRLYTSQTGSAIRQLERLTKANNGLLELINKN